MNTNANSLGSVNSSATTVTISEQPALRLIGKNVRTDMARASADCSMLFQTFGPRMYEIPTNGGGASYGISYSVAGESQDAFDYWAALPVAANASVPAGMAACEIPAGLYASTPFNSFREIAAAFQKLYMQWLPAQTEYTLRTDAPCYEFYAADAMHTGCGIVYMPVIRKQ